MRMVPLFHLYRLLFGLPLLFSPVLSAEIRVELIELPPVTAQEGPGSAGSPRLHLSLSERFEESGQGRRFVRMSPEKPFHPAREVTLYTDPSLLSRCSPAHSHVVVDLSKQRAYLMVGQDMALESEVAVHQFGQTTPAGFFNLSERVKNGPIAEAVRTRVPYWMQLGSTEFGLHGGHLYGYLSAGGCVRFPLPAAEILFEKTQEGTPVAIFETWSRETYSPPQDLPSVALLAAEEVSAPAPDALVGMERSPALAPEPAVTPSPAPMEATSREPEASPLLPVRGAPVAVVTPSLPPPKQATPPIPTSPAPSPVRSGPPPVVILPAQAPSRQIHAAPPVASPAPGPSPAISGPPESQEVARIRSLFQKDRPEGTPPTNRLGSPPPAPLPSPASQAQSRTGSADEKYLKRLEVATDRAQKKEESPQKSPESPRAATAATAAPAAPPSPARIRKLFGNDPGNRW